MPHRAGSGPAAPGEGVADQGGADGDETHADGCLGSTWAGRPSETARHSPGGYGARAGGEGGDRGGADRLSGGATAPGKDFAGDSVIRAPVLIQMVWIAGVHVEDRLCVFLKGEVTAIEVVLSMCDA